MKKLLSLILAGLILSSGMIACSDKTVKETESSSSDASTETESETLNDEFIFSTTYYNDMPAQDFDGWVMNIAGGYGVANNGGVCEHITVDQLSGDEFDDDLFNRIISVNDKYNVSVLTHDVDVPASIKLSVVSGTQDFALGADTMESLPQTINGECAMSVTELDTVNLDNPYWDQSAKKQLMIHDKMYYCLSDMSFSHYDSVAVLYYNGGLLEDHQITESPYDLYKDGRWTLERMYEMVEAVSRDVTGDGKLTVGEDIIGLVGRELRFMPPLSSSCTDLILWDDENETFTLNLAGEEVIAIGEWLGKICLNESLAKMDKGDAIAAFKADRALFDSRLLGNFRSLRDKEDDYGIIPWPALEENTEIKFYNRNPTAVFVAAGNDHPDETGTLMDAMAAYAYDYIIEDYIHKAVIGKGARDRESADVIIQLLDKRVYDLSYSFGMDSVGFAWENAIAKGNFVSMAKTIQKVFDRSVVKALKIYED